MRKEITLSLFPTRTTLAATAVLAATSVLAAVPAAQAAPATRTLAPAGVLGMPGTGPGRPAAVPQAPPVTAPLSPSQCRRLDGAPCYDAQLLRHLYGLDTTLARDGINGRGVTAVLVLPWQDPVLRHDLDTYALASGLPVPDLTIIRRGHPGIANPANPNQAVGEQEGILDAEMIDTAAPAVHLVYVETQGDVLDSPAAFTKALDTLAWLRHRGIRPWVSSWSWGWFEQNYAQAAGSAAKGAAQIRARAQVIAAAVRAGTTVVSADGDTGPTGPNLDGTALYTKPTVAFIASDPLVTAVSATQLHAGDSGTRTSPDTVWTDNGSGFATGGGRSAVFARPAWQNGDKKITGAHRGVADIAMDGSLQSPVWMYTSRYQTLPGQAPGWVQVAGTSAAAPLMAGIIADADQLAGHPLGNINPRLYQLARHDTANGIADVTAGCNTDGGVTGWCATRGYDLPSGVGTIADAARLVPALART
jgi:kumamolisin